MNAICRLRFIAATVALLSVLFAQVAVAAYACPGVEAMARTAVAMADMPDCDMPNPGERSPICLAHCQQGDQSLDKPAPSLQGLAVAWGHPVALEVRANVEGASGPPGARDFLLERPIEPHATARHCRLHI